MATDPNKKYLERPVEVTQAGLQNILSAGSEGEEKPSFAAEMTQRALSVTGKDTSDTPAILVERGLNQDGTTYGLTSLQAEQQATKEGYTKQREKTSAITANQKELLGVQEYYNESGAVQGAISNIASAAEMGGKVVHDTVSIGILKGGYFNSIANSLQEEDWRARVNSAKEIKDESYENFSKRMGVYKEAKDINGVDEVTTFTDFASLGLDASAFASLKSDNLKIRNNDGTYRDPTADEMAWFERYRNLNRSRVADQKARNLQNFFNEEIAEYSTWLDEVTDSRGNKYTTARNASNVIGSAVGSALLFELAAAPAGAVNFAGQAIRAKSVVKAATTANKAWRGSVLTNPYILSKGGGIYSSATGGTATFVGAFMQQYTETKAQALAAGWDPVTAGRIAAKNAGLQAIVESVGYERFLHKYLMGGREFRGFFMNAMLPEGMEEVIQTGVDDYFTNKYGMDSTTMQELAGNMWMSFLGGAAGAIGIGAIHTATNVGGHLVTGDYRKLSQAADPNVNTKDWLKQIGVDTSVANTKENRQNVGPKTSDVMSKFKEFVDNQKKQQTQESAIAKEQGQQAAGQTQEGPLQLTYNINYDWAPTVISSMSNGKKMAFNEFCSEHNVDVNNHEELREALLMWTGNENMEFVADPNTEDAQMDRAAAELSAVMDTISSEEFELEQPAITQERMRNERDMILAAAKEDYARRAKQENPRITKKQIEDGWEATSKLFRDDLDSGEMTAAIADEAMENLAILSQDARIAQATKEATVRAAKKTQNVIDTKALRLAITGKGTERYNAQWDVAQQILENRIVLATGNRTLAKAVSTLIRKTYYKSLMASPDVNPVEFISKAAPDFITQAGLRRNGIRIAGLQGLEAKMQQIGVRDSIDYVKSVNAILANQIEQYKGLEDGEDKNQLAQSILYGLFGESATDVKIEDALAFVDTVAREEMKIHKSIGSGKIVSNLSESDFTLIALLRLRGASETEIFRALGISDTNTLNNLEEYYRAAVETYYPAPKQDQLAALESLGAMVRKNGAEGEFTGTFDATNPQGTSFVFLTGEEQNETVTHEVSHWITELSRQIAEAIETRALFSLGENQRMSLGDVQGEAFPFSNRNIASFYTRIVEVITQREGMKNLTQTEIAETIADFLTRYLMEHRNIDPELAAAFQAVFGAVKPTANIVGSKYNELTKQEKTKIRNILGETFDTQVLDHAQEQITEAEGLRDALKQALASVDNNSTTESPAYQIYNKLSTYLSSRPNKSGPINRGLSKIVKAYDAFKQNSNNNLLKGAVITAALETINELEAEGQKAMVDLMFQQAYPADQFEGMQPVDDPSIPTEEDNKYSEEWDVLDEILERNDKKKAQGGEVYFRMKQDDNRTETEKMRGAPTLKEGLKQTFKGFRWKGFREAFNSLTASVVEYANKVHPMLGAAIRAACYEINEMKTYNAEIAERWYNTFDEYNKWAVKNGKDIITNKEFEVYKNFLINHKRNAAFEYMEKRLADNPEIQEQLHGMHIVLAARLDECYGMMLQMGFQLEEVAEYFPSIVKDREEYAIKKYKDILEAERITGKKILPDWQRKLKGKYETEVRKKIRKMLKKMDAGEQINIVDVVNAVNAELGHPEDKLSAPHLYKVQNMSKGMDYNPYYMDVFDAFQLYTNDVANKFLNYRLLGKAKFITDENGNQRISDQSGIVGSILTGLQLANIPGYDYDPDVENAFIKALQQTLSRKENPKDVFSVIKQIQTYMTLGRLTSAFNQFLELAPTMMRYGLLPSVKAMFQAMSKENPLTINTLGIQPLNEIYKIDDNGSLGRLNRFMLSANGFTKADILMKNTVIVATMANAQEMIARDEEYGNTDETYGQRRFHRAFEETFPSPAYSDAQRARILSDIKAGNLTTDVKLFLRNALAATQPIDLAEVPAKYNSLGNMGRAMYFLSVVSIKQMRYLWDQFVQDYRNGGVKDAAINMSRFLWFACLVGVPPDWLKDIVHGKQPNIRETAFYSPLQYFMINKYFTSVLKDKGISAAVGMRFTIGNEFGDDLIRAILNKEPWYMVRVVPFGGEMLDHWYGVAHKRYVRHNEALNKYESASAQLVTKGLKKNFDFFGWKI